MIDENCTIIIQQRNLLDAPLLEEDKFPATTKVLIKQSTLVQLLLTKTRLVTKVEVVEMDGMTVFD